jgi:hypothetical protein
LGFIKKRFFGIDFAQNGCRIPIFFKDNRSPVKSLESCVTLAFAGGGGYTLGFIVRLKIKQQMSAIRGKRLRAQP